MTIIAVGLANLRAFVLPFIYLAWLSLVAGDFLPFPIWRAAYAVAASGELTGPDDLFAGRALSLIALAVVAFEIFAAVRTLCSGPTLPQRLTRCDVRYFC